MSSRDSRSPATLGAVLAIALLTGTAVLAVAALIHPMLTGSPDVQLRTIADMHGWRALHLTMLLATGLVIVGIWVRLLSQRGTSVAPLLIALAVLSVGLAINALNIAFMAGAGWRMATLFAQGRADMVDIFEVTHPIGLMAARFGNLLVALGAAALGWVEWRDAAQPRWLAALAWIAAAGGIIGVAAFDESSRAVLGAVALLSGWQAATGVRALLSARA